MFWVENSERVISDQQSQPCSLTMDKWKEKRRWNLWVTRDGLIRAWVHTLEKKTSLLNRYWQRHTSDKNGIWYDMTLKGPTTGVCSGCTQPCQKQPNLRVDLDEQDRTMEWWKMDWTEICFVCEDFFQTVWNNKCRDEPFLDLNFAHGIIGEGVTWVFFREHEWITDTNVIWKKARYESSEVWNRSALPTQVETCCSWKDKKETWAIFQTRTSIMVRKICAKMKLPCLYEKIVENM